MKIIVALAIMLTIPSYAQNDSPKPVDRVDETDEEKRHPNANATDPIVEGMTIEEHLKLFWNDKAKLPTSVQLKNPFKETLHILTSPKSGAVGYPDFEIEYYDPHLKEWRSPPRLPGSFGGINVLVKQGQSKEFKLHKDYWWFVVENLPSLVSSKATRIRLVYGGGGVCLRSSEFKWDTTKK
ncbi:MAG: hypothetical protein H7A51_13420 [Akkermansiaceae bacterium]|nr:hypothetical protein [Akkermansiaceae bacterium]